MSACWVASCLAHRRRVFFQGWGEDAGQWCHTNGWPCRKDPNTAPTFSSSI